MLTYENIQDIYPLSPLQKGMYFHSLIDKSTNSYFEQIVYRLDGAIQESIVRQSMEELMKRHDILRTVFDYEKKDIPLQIVLKQVPLEYYFEDVTTLDQETKLNRKQAYRMRDRQRSFALNRDVLIRLALFKMDDHHFEFIWSHHHIILDGWCAEILVAEFFEMYTSMIAGRAFSLPKPLPFRRYIEWIEKQDQSASAAFWKSYLEGYNTKASLPTSKQQNGGTSTSKRHLFQLSQAHSATIDRLAQELQSTPNILYQSIWGVLLSRYNQCRDVVFGYVVSGRPTELVGIERTLGLFINTAPLRIRYEESDTFQMLVRRTHKETTERQNHEYYSLADIQAQSDLRQDLLDHLYGFQNFTQADTYIKENSDLTTATSVELNGKLVEAWERTNYAFTIRIAPGIPTGVMIEYDSDLFDSELITQIESDFKAMVLQVVTNPDVCIDRMLLTSLNEEQQARWEQLNQTKRAYPEDKNIVTIFQEQVALHPEAIAVRWNDEVYTYSQLDHTSNQLAHFLLSQGLRAEEPVCILMESSINRIVVMLAVLKAGGAYLPMGTEIPFDRKKHIVNEVQSRFLLSEKKWIHTINNLQWECAPLHTILCIDSADVYAEIEPLNELMKKELWDHIGKESFDDISGGGWLSSYTGENLSRQVMDEYGENILRKLKPLLSPDARVLEVGCASGISMFRLAPLVREYVGTDLSDEILKKTEEARKQRGLTNITLAPITAHEIDRLTQSDFDVVIINSVIQCFNGHNYLRDVLKKAIHLMKEEGLIFLGDIMDLYQKEALLESLGQFKKENQGNGYKTKTDYLHELFLTLSFFEDLQHDFPEIINIAHTKKVGEVSSELTDFRFDVLLTINKKASAGLVHKQERKKFQFGENDWKQHSTQAPNRKIEASSLAYIIFTSGTTGFPKGVMIEHKGVLRLVLNTDYMKVGLGAVWAQTVDFSFDPSNLEIFGALLNGAALCLVPKQILLQAELFETMLKERGITHMVLITPLFHALAAERPRMFRSLNTLIIGGEALDAHWVNIVLDHCPGLRIINAYGPTENTVISTTKCLQQAVDTMTIGKPMSNSEAYLLDVKGELLPVGKTGELVVAGDGIARGYLNQVELTHSLFIPHPLRPQERAYRTGDRARLNVNNEIEFLGRIDEQVKVRGYRIELKEIEKQVLSIDGVIQCMILLIGVEEEKQITAFVTYMPSFTEDHLRRELSKRLPSYMIPSFIHLLDSFPRTDNDKIDRKALIALSTSSIANSLLDKERFYTEEERRLEAIWCEVLHLKFVKVNANFFEIGGHSLKAMQLVSRIAKEFKVQIDLRDFFENPTIGGVAKLLNRKGQTVDNPILPAPVQDFYELSHAQKRLWILHQYEENQVAYNISGALQFEGLNVEAFEKALLVLVDRHESLRTTFSIVHSEPRQKIHAAADLSIGLQISDLRNEKNIDTLAKEIANSEARTAFNLERGPLVRMRLLQLDEEKCLFIFTLHHIICDGWSMRILLQEVALVYDAFLQNLAIPLEPLTIQYKDFVHWQNQRIRQKDEQYWLSKLSNKVNWIKLPQDFADTQMQTFEGAEDTLILDDTIKDQLQQIAQSHHTSLSNVIFSIFNIFLYNISGHQDLAVGVAIANRDQTEIEQIVGFFVNTLVIRTSIKEDMEFSDVVKQVEKNMIEAFDHQSYPFDLLVEKLNPNRITDKQPLFNVLYGFQSFEDVHIETRTAPANTPAQSASLKVKNFNQDYSSAKFDLTLYVYNRPVGIELCMEYNSALFTAATVSKWLQYFEKFTSMLLTESQQVQQV